MTTVPHITAAEFKIMKVIWRLQEATVRLVKDELDRTGEEPLAYTTIMTMMNQLGAKGALAVDKTRQPFLYRPGLRREQVIAQRVSQFIQQVFDGQAGELVLRLVEDSELSPDDLKRIEAKIEAREQSDGDNLSKFKRVPRASGDDRGETMR